MAELIITRGLPASGKSTWAENWKTQGEKRVLIGRDFIRLEILRLGSTKGTREEEDYVTALQNAMVRKSLAKGYDVCVDDTNLPLQRAKDWADLARELGVGFRVEDFTWVPLELCIERNSWRLAPKRLPDNIIAEMHKRYHLGTSQFETTVQARESAPVQQYVPDGDLPEAFIFDIDGTCAQMLFRGPFEWHKVDTDAPVWWVRQIALALHNAGYKIVYLSGRDAVCRQLTQGWLDRKGFPPGPLFMRPQKDMRKDSLVKGELFWTQIAEFYNVCGVFDDRDSVVHYWRSIGVNCAQVNYGNF